jgi:hypothetical protein
MCYLSGHAWRQRRAAGSGAQLASGQLQWRKAWWTQLRHSPIAGSGGTLCNTAWHGCSCPEHG